MTQTFFIQSVVRHEASQYLDVTKTLRQQDKDNIRDAIIHVIILVF